MTLHGYTFEVGQVWEFQPLPGGGTFRRRVCAVDACSVWFQSEVRPDVWSHGFKMTWEQFIRGVTSQHGTLVGGAGRRAAAAGARSAAHRQASLFAAEL